MEEGIATHSSILAWSIPRTEEPGRMQSIALQRVADLSETGKMVWYSVEELSTVFYDPHS